MIVHPYRILKKFSFILFVVILVGCSSHPVPTLLVTPTRTPTPLSPQAIDLGTYGLGAAKDMMWSPNGKMLVVESSADGYVYDTSNWSMLSEIPRSTVQDGWLTQLTFFPDQQHLLFTAGYGKLFWRYDLNTQKISRAFENIDVKAFAKPFFSPDGRLFAFGSSICPETNASVCKPVLNVYDANTGELLHAIPENDLDQWEDISVYAFSPDSTLIASGGDSNVVRVFDVASGMLKYQFQHESDVKSLSFSPDGTVLASAGLDAAVRFWNMQSGKSLYTLHGTVDEFYQSAAYMDGGRKLLVNYSDGKFKEYTLDEHFLPTVPLDLSFETEKRLMTEMGQYTPDLIFRVSPDGQQMAVLVNGNIQIWDLQNGKKTYTLPEYLREVYAIGFSPDENLLAVADQNVHLWQIEPKRFLGTLEVNGDEVIDIAFHPDGKQAAFALLGGNAAEVWDLNQRRKLRTIVAECPGSTISYSRRANLAYSPDGSKLAFSGGCTIVLADATTGKLLQQFPNDLGESAALAFSADGRTLIYVSVNGYRAWDLQTGKQVYSIKRVDDYQNSAALSSSLLAITSWNDPIRFLDPLTGKRLYEFPSGKGQNEIAISRDGRLLALDNYSKISLLDSTSGAELLSMDFQLPYTIEFSPTGKYVGARSYQENVHLWDVSSVLKYARQVPPQTATPNVELTPTAQPTSTPAPTLEVSMPPAPASTALAVNSLDMKKLGELGIGRIHTMAWSPDGKLLAAGGYPGAYIFHAGELQPAQFLPAKSDLLVMQYSSDGRYLAGQVSNDSILLWDLQSEKSTHTLKNAGCWNQGMEFTADNEMLIADCGDQKYTWLVESGALVSVQTQTVKDGPLSGPYTLQTNMRNVRLIRAASGEIVKTFEIPGMAPSLARFSPDGKTLAVWQYEYQIARTGLYYPTENSKTILQLWNIYPDRPPSLRAELATGVWHQDLMILEAFQGLAFSSDSRLLATASGDGTTQVWNVGSGRLVHTLPTGNKIYFSPDNKYLATLDDDSAHIWNISSSAPQIIWEISGFNRWSYDIAFAKGGQELVDVTDEYYKFFPVTNTNLTAPSYQVKLPGKRGYQLALSADGSRMAYNTTEEILVGKNNGGDPNWQVLTKFPEPLTFDRDLSLTFSQDGSLLASFDPDDQKRIWDLETMKSIELENPASTPHVFISEFLFSPDGTLLFGAQEAKTYEPSSLYLWDTRTGKLVRYWVARIYKYAFHPTQPLFVGADYMSGVLRFFDLRTGDLVKELRASQHVQEMAFSPDGNLLVLGYDSTGYDEGRIEIRDAQTLKLIYEIPKGASSFAFSPDGTILAIGLNDGRIEYWKLIVK
jgi:WD40 repeat protein